VEHTVELSKAISRLGGEVKHIIAPNYEHLKYIKEWAIRYPKASLYACPGLPERLPDVDWDVEFGAEINKPNEKDVKDINEKPISEDFSDSIEWLWLDCEKNPFTGRPFFNEVVFFHKKSKTFFCADAFWNYPSRKRMNYFGVSNTGTIHQCSKVSITGSGGSNTFPDIKVPFGSLLWKFGMDKIYLPFYKRFMVKDQFEKYRTLVDTIISWDIETIAPCHGDVIKGKDLCKEVLVKHFL
jgi:hypothetical protein